MAKGRLIFLRNFRAHRQYFHENPPTGNVFCSRCGNPYCSRNTTPTRLLPMKKDFFGKIRQSTCAEFVRDPILPVDLGRYPKEKP